MRDIPKDTEISIIFSRVAKIMHAFLGIVPFIWFLCFLSILLSGIIHLGYLPKEGNPIDPNALGLSWLEIIHSLFFFFGYIAFYLWIITALFQFIFFRQNFSIHKASSVLFVIGVLGYLVFNYLLTEAFYWVLD